MENPGEWNRATNVISKALKEYREDFDPKVCGNTEPCFIANYLEYQGCLNSRGQEIIGLQEPPPPHNELLASFTAYLLKNPEQRFWQALRGWSGQDYILARKDVPSEYPDQQWALKEQVVDTFHWEGRTGPKRGD